MISSFLMQSHTPTTLVQNSFSPPSVLIKLPLISLHITVLMGSPRPLLSPFLYQHLISQSHFYSYSSFPFIFVSLNSNTSNFLFLNIHLTFSFLASIILHPLTRPLGFRESLQLTAIVFFQPGCEVCNQAVTPTTGVLSMVNSVKQWACLSQ